MLLPYIPGGAFTPVLVGFGGFLLVNRGKTLLFPHGGQNLCLGFIFKKVYHYGSGSVSCGGVVSSNLRN